MLHPEQAVEGTRSENRTLVGAPGVGCESSYLRWRNGRSIKEVSAVNANQKVNPAAALLTFADSAPDGYWQLELPTDAERAIASMANELLAMSSEQVAEVRSRLSFRSACALEVCSKRMASWAVRTSERDLLKLAVFLLLVSDDDQTDWRDVLTSLSWVDYCATLLGVRLEDLVSKVIDIATASRRSTIVGYLSREPAARTPECMGLAPVGAGPTFHFRWLP